VYKRQGVAFAPEADGLRAVYRDCTVTRPLPWRFTRTVV
jgi:hypothetical protein